MTPYQRLEAWHFCHELVLLVYRLTATWPVHERYGLAGQARRAAISIPTNLAEGSARRGPREFRRHIDIALGSLSELTYLLQLARDLGYLSPKDFAEVEEVRDRAGRVTWRLYQANSGATR